MFRHVARSSEKDLGLIFNLHGCAEPNFVFGALVGPEGIVED